MLINCRRVRGRRQDTSLRYADVLRPNAKCSHQGNRDGGESPDIQPVWPLAC